MFIFNYGPSFTACMPKIKTRSVTVENLCDFDQAEEMEKVAISSILFVSRRHMWTYF